MNPVFFFESRFFAVLPTLMFPAKKVEMAGVGKGAEMGLPPLFVDLRDAVSVEGSNISQSYFMICLALAWWPSGVFSMRASSSWLPLEHGGCHRVGALLLQEAVMSLVSSRLTSGTRRR